LKTVTCFLKKQETFQKNGCLFLKNQETFRKTGIRFLFFLPPLSLCDVVPDQKQKETLTKKFFPVFLSFFFLKKNGWGFLKKSRNFSPPWTKTLVSDQNRFL